MNCQEFQEAAVELARGASNEDATRETILAHADSCARCAARLAAERSLSAGLRAAAKDSAERDAAPPRVEAALLQAFRARHAQTTAETATQVAAATANAPASTLRSFAEAAAARDARATEPRHEASLSSTRAGWWLRVAAVLLVTTAAGLTAVSILRTGPQTNDPAGTTERAAGSDAADASHFIATSTAPADVDATGSPTATQSPVSLGAQPSPAHEGQRAPMLYVNADASRASSPRATRGRGNGRLSREAVGRLMANSRSDDSTNAEITTDFFPMSDASALATMDGGHVIRVELPASALVSFGLPVTADRAGGRVKADVLIGNDGLARAIRFVR
jgi:hypothetical protein